MSYLPWRFERGDYIFDPTQFISYDSEFMRESFYYPQLALVQIYQPTRPHVALFDPLCDAIPWAGLANHPQPIVVHDGRQDLELMQLSCGKLPRCVRDTQIGFALFQPVRMVSYADLVAHFLGITIAKDETRSNWLERPLTPAQLAYAADDVAPLSAVYPLLSAELARLGRLTWWAEECAHLIDIDKNDPNAPFAWFHLKRSLQLLRTPHERHTAAILSLAREKIAQAENLPRRTICSDEKIIALAKKNLHSVEHLAEYLPPDETLWQQLPLISAGFAGDIEDDLSLSLPPTGMRKSLNPREKILYKKLYRQSEGIAAELNISIETLLGSRRNLKNWCIAPHPDNPLCHGWRASFFRDLLC